MTLGRFSDWSFSETFTECVLSTGRLEAASLFAASSSWAWISFCSATQSLKAFCAVSPSSVLVSLEKVTDFRRSLVLIGDFFILLGICFSGEML